MIYFSFSRIKLLHDCPYKYKLFNVDKHVLPSSDPAIFGQAAHRIYRDIIVKGYERKKAIGLWKNYFIDECIGNNESIVIFPKENYWMTKGYPIINIFYKNLDSFNIKKVLCAEKKFKSTYEGHIVTLVTDLIYEDNDGRIILADYKTGKEKDVDYYQLQFYKDHLGMKIDACKLYYTFQGLIEFPVDKYKKETDEYISKGLDILVKGDFYKNVKKECKQCYFFKNSLCDAKKIDVKGGKENAD